MKKSLHLFWTSSSYATEHYCNAATSKGVVEEPYSEQVYEGKQKKLSNKKALEHLDGLSNFYEEHDYVKEEDIDSLFSI